MSKPTVPGDERRAVARWLDRWADRLAGGDPQEISPWVFAAAREIESGAHLRPLVSRSGVPIIIRSKGK